MEMKTISAAGKPVIAASSSIGIVNLNEAPKTKSAASSP
jgi:hypothetical protein